MASIKATFSALQEYSVECADNYSQMLGIAQEILEKNEKLHREIMEDHENISRQLDKLLIMKDELERKIKGYENQMEEAERTATRYRETIEYLYNNPKKVTKTDKDGNQYTETVYDYNAIQVAQKKEEEAMQMYYHYSGKRDEAMSVSYELNSTIERFEAIKGAIYASAEMILSNIYEIKKYISFVTDEAEHNCLSLRGVIMVTDDYLASQNIVCFGGTTVVSSGGGDGYTGTPGSSGSSGGTTYSYRKGAIVGTGNSSHRGRFKSSLNKKLNFLRKIDVFGIFEAIIRRAQDKYDKSQFDELVNSKAELRQMPRSYDDRIVFPDNEFFGIEGGHYADECNLLIEKQGDNLFNTHAVKNKEGKMQGIFSGTCGLASLANILRLFGKYFVTETDVVKTACEKKLCGEPEYNRRGILGFPGGGTTDEDIVGLANEYELDAAISPNLSLDEIDAVIRRGGAVMMSVVATDLKGAPINGRLRERCDHWVSVMGVTRNSFGRITGVVVRDTGGFCEDATVLIEAERFAEMRGQSKDFSGVCFFKRGE